MIMINDPTLWHKRPNFLFPRRTIDGGWTGMNGTTWQRFNQATGRWEYRHEPETLAEYLDRVI